MASFDDRIVKVGIEIDGQLRMYDLLYITAKGTKFANPNQNECEVQIANLTKQVRDQLVTETSPFNDNRTPKKLVVEAGRVSTGTSRIFVGDIVSATPSQPPDIMLTIKAKTGNFLKGKVTSRSEPAMASLKSISEKTAADLGLTLQFEANDKNLTNPSYVGAASKQVDDLQETGGVDAYIDDDKLVVKDRNVPLNGSLRILNKSTGLVGIPETDEQGGKCVCLFDNQTTLGGAIQLEVDINPAQNGTYCIYKLGFNVSSRDVPFYLMPEFKRLNR